MCIADLYLIGLCIFSLTILIFYYYIFHFLNLKKKKNEKTVIFNDPVSVIICAKNEVDNLRKMLPIILSQDYFRFEVVIVNDQSIDQTSSFLKEMKKDNDNLVIVTIDKHINSQVGKKFALTLGIKTAKYEHLLLTDADCTPSSKDWISITTRQFADHDIILGHGSYEKMDGLLNKLIRYDNFIIAQQYLSYALAGMTYMGVGRNLAYKKSLFFKNKGFANHMNIASGDDDLFIQEISKDNITGIETNKDAHTISQVNRRWLEWIYQKRRHITTAAYYSLKFKILLTIYPVMQVLFWTSIILMLLSHINIYLTLLLLLLKLICTYYINYTSMKRLNAIDLYIIHPVYELLSLLIQGIFVLLNIFEKPKKWNK